MKPDFITEKPRLNIYLSIGLMALYVITFAVDWFTSRQITVISFVMCTCTLAFIFAFFHRFQSMYYIPAVTFAFFALYLGTMLKFYALIPIYDLLLHGASGILLAFGGHLLQSMMLWKKKDYVIPTRITVAFSIFFAMAAAGVWEIWEYSGDVLFGLSSQGTGIDDTMTDIIAGCVSGVIGGGIIYLIIKLKQAKQLPEKK